MAGLPQGLAAGLALRGPRTSPMGMRIRAFSRIRRAHEIGQGRDPVLWCGEHEVGGQGICSVARFLDQGATPVRGSWSISDNRRWLMRVVLPVEVPPATRILARLRSKPSSRNCAGAHVKGENAHWRHSLEGETPRRLGFANGRRSARTRMAGSKPSKRSPVSAIQPKPARGRKGIGPSARHLMRDKTG